MRSPRTFNRHALSGWLCIVAGLGLAACEHENAPPEPEQTAQLAAECDADNGGLIMPGGFCARVVVDNLGFVRHIAVAP
ncbi:MAG: hypothetical protein WD709_02305, partial [Gammaproteobacteria bacterium]